MRHSERRGGGRGESQGVEVLTVGGVILHKVFGLLCCDHVDVTHLHTHNTGSRLNPFRLLVTRYSSIRSLKAVPVGRETHLVSEFDTIELISGLQQLRPEGGRDELGVARQLHDHVCKGVIVSGHGLAAGAREH